MYTHLATAQPHTIAVSGAAYCITAVTCGRQRLFADATNCRTVLDALAFQRTQRKIRLFAYVVMPDHLHWLIGVDEPHD